MQIFAPWKNYTAFKNQTVQRAKFSASLCRVIAHSHFAHEYLSIARSGSVQKSVDSDEPTAKVAVYGEYFTVGFYPPTFDGDFLAAEIAEVL